MFKFNDENYATSKPEEVEEIEPTLPRIDYTEKSAAEIHLAINHSLQQTQEIASRLAKKKKPTNDNTTIIEASRNATPACIELANRTYEDTKKFNKLGDIGAHLKITIGTEQDETSDSD
jgi:hypothetical protein